MNAINLLTSQDDLDQTMRLVARNLAMGIYDIDQILQNCAVKAADFNRWKENPRFVAYVRAETEAWNAASNVATRTKLKAGFVVEEWLLNAYGELTNGKIPLNQRVELGKLVAKIAGMDNSTPAGGASAGDASGFTLQINIGTVKRTFATEEATKVIDIEPDAVEQEEPQPVRKRALSAIELINSDLGIPE